MVFKEEEEESWKDASFLTIDKQALVKPRNLSSLNCLPYPGRDRNQKENRKLLKTPKYRIYPEEKLLTTISRQSKQTNDTQERKEGAEPK